MSAMGGKRTLKLATFAATRRRVRATRRSDRAEEAAKLTQNFQLKVARAP
jgi:hypothetical protein